MIAKDVLRKKGNEIYSVPPDETVFNAISKMADLNIGALLVMENDRLVGIISERDYRNKVILKGRASKTTKVKEIMVDEVVCVQANDKVRLCMQLMSDNKFRHLPVLENDKVVGVISIGDVVKSIIDKQKVEISSLRKYIATGGAYPN